jgi:hypothetical protein
VYAAPIKNLKNETLVDAVRAMAKVKGQILSFLFFTTKNFFLDPRISKYANSPV